MDVCHWTRADRAPKDFAGFHTAASVGWKNVGLSSSVSAQQLLPNSRDFYLPCHDPHYGQAIGMVTSQLFKHPLRTPKTESQERIRSALAGSSDVSQMLSPMLVVQFKAGNSVERSPGDPSAIAHLIVARPMWLLLQYAVDNASHERVLNPFRRSISKGAGLTH